MHSLHVTKWHWGRFSFEYFSFPVPIIISPMFHPHYHEGLTQAAVPTDCLIPPRASVNWLNFCVVLSCDGPMPRPVSPIEWLRTISERRRRRRRRRRLLLLLHLSRGSSVNIVAKLAYRAHIFIFRHRVQIGSGVHPASYAMRTEGSFPGTYSWSLTSIKCH
jgi:hypothetical protein